MKLKLFTFNKKKYNKSFVYVIKTKRGYYAGFYSVINQYGEHFLAKKFTKKKNKANQYDTFCSVEKVAKSIFIDESEYSIKLIGV